MDMAITQTIEHWGKMIVWVETRNLQSPADRFEMQQVICEHWGGSYCPLCIEYDGDCEKCPLYYAQGRFSCGAKNALWRKIDASYTWEEWLSYARPLYALLETLEEKGKKR